MKRVLIIGLLILFSCYSVMGFVFFETQIINGFLVVDGEASRPIANLEFIVNPDPGTIIFTGEPQGMPGFGESFGFDDDSCEILLSGSLNCSFLNLDPPVVGAGGIFYIPVDFEGRGNVRLELTSVKGPDGNSLVQDGLALVYDTYRANYYSDINWLLAHAAPVYATFDYDPRMMSLLLYQASLS